MDLPYFGFEYKSFSDIYIGKIQSAHIMRTVKLSKLNFDNSNTPANSKCKFGPS